MAMFEAASEFVIHDAHFIAGNAIYHGPHEDSSQIRKLVEKDSSLNQYSAEHGTVTLPYFPKYLLLRDLQVDPDAGRISAGGCSFDLLARLGLFPGQPNEALAEYDTNVPLNEVISRGKCYCGRISRHGFIFLVSKYFQHASVEKTKGGTCFILSTSIGRFKCYEIDDRIFVHFDSGTRSSQVDLIDDQNLGDILRASRGECQLAPFPGSIDVSIAEFEWHRSIDRPIESTATHQLYGVPNAVLYMTKSTLRRWKRLEEFGQAVITSVLSILDGITEPADFISVLRTEPFDSPNYTMPSTPAGGLASCISTYRLFDRARICEVPYNVFIPIIYSNIHYMFEAHKYFRSPRVELPKLTKTSHDRFLKILDGFQTTNDFNAARRPTNTHIQRELQALLDTNKNNVALVAFQGFFALITMWNASRILLRAREAPDEWIQFVGADDDMIYIG